jgi:hypothetical protein
MGRVFSLVNTRITVQTETLERIIEILNVPTKADRDRILRDGILIVKATSLPSGGGPQPARARSSRSSTGTGASSTRSRTSRRRT